MAIVETQQAPFNDEIENVLGVVPHWFAQLPPEAAKHLWGTMRDLQFAQTRIPAKYKELIGLAVAASNGCWYGTHFHTETAKLHGASDEEIAEVDAMASLTMALCTFLTGQRVDHDKFQKDMKQMVKFQRNNA